MIQGIEQYKTDDRTDNGTYDKKEHRTESKTKQRAGESIEDSE